MQMQFCRGNWSDLRLRLIIKIMFFVYNTLFSKMNSVTIKNAKENAKNKERIIEEELAEMVEELKEFKRVVRNMCNDFINRATLARREIRKLRKTQTIKKPKNVRGPKSGEKFAEVCLISDDLCDFLNVAHGSKLFRNDIDHGINAYISAHKLKDPKDGRIIHPDEVLSGLLSEIPSNVVLTYFNMQTYLKHHYPREAVDSNLK